MPKGSMTCLIGTQLSDGEVRRLFSDATHGLRPPQLMIYGFQRSAVAGQPSALGMTVVRGGKMKGTQIAMDTERDADDPKRLRVSMWTSVSKGFIFTTGSAGLGLFFKHVAAKISEADATATVDYVR